MLLTAAGAPARSTITLKTTMIAATINGHFRISFKAILHTLQPADKDNRYRGHHIPVTVSVRNCYFAWGCKILRGKIAGRDSFFSDPLDNPVNLVTVAALYERRRSSTSRQRRRS